jgi:DNA-directed RNA polymerase specialized sigma24 family protein
VNNELNVELALLDTIIMKWSVEQAEVALEYFKGKTQEQMAEYFQIAQSSIRKRLYNANLEQITLLENRFGSLLAKYEKEGETIAL